MESNNFFFLKTEFPLLYNVAQSAELYIYTDPVVSIIKLRQFEEHLLGLIFKEHRLPFPKENTLHAKIKMLYDEDILSSNISGLLHLIKEKGNIATHQIKGTTEEALQILRSACKVAVWFFETYADAVTDLTQLRFTEPAKVNAEKDWQTLENKHKELEEKFNQLFAARDTNGISDNKQQAIQQRSQKAAKKIEWNEAETRDIIDEQLSAAGWEADTRTINYKLCKTVPSKEKNKAIAEWPVAGGWADYALFKGTAFYGIVEAKKYAQDISADLRQAKRYSEGAEEMYNAKLPGKWGNYKVPFLFSTNGRPFIKQIKTKSGIWFLDVRNEYNNAYPLHGWYSPEGLQKQLEKDIKTADQKLADSNHDFLQSAKGLNLRDYQIAAIKAVETAIKEPHRRRALVAMATGTGKTRTIIGLCYQLIQTNRFNRILFLVDRTLLGRQAIDAFTDNKVAGLHTFSDIYEIKNLKDALPGSDTRLHFATVQSLVKRLFYNDSPDDMPTVDQYDCIIIDEAHRGYTLDREMDEEDLLFKDQNDYISQYKKVVDYFDAFAIGLTATPALHTREIFGTAVYNYSYTEAVIDGYLIDHDPPYIIKTKLSEDGIHWEQGEKPKAYNTETNSIVELEALEDELHFDVAGFNKMVVTENFNRTVIKQLVPYLDPDGEEKTLIFAATDAHADLIKSLLFEEFKAIGIDVSHHAIEKITGRTDRVRDVYKNFQNEKFPNIAVTVDLLTTGIDIPAICNLVFLRRVKSRILYEQMLGRATRRCDDIGKETFRIFDAVRIYEALEDYTQMKPVVVNPLVTFAQLAEEMEHIQSEERMQKQVEQIVAKLQRKKRTLEEADISHFAYLAEGAKPDELIEFFKTQTPSDSSERIKKLSPLWRLLDELKPSPALNYVSEHEDEHLGTERGYGKGNKPEDYLQSFADFILNNQNKIAALNIVCTRPKTLDRQSLRELVMTLDREGFNRRTLQTAWKAAKNEDIAADLISYIRTLAMGDALVSHTNRIKNAVNSARKQKAWNAAQSKWLDKIELQLLAETVITVADIDKEPFAESGGFSRLNKIFGGELASVIDTINENLYNQTG